MINGIEFHVPVRRKTIGSQLKSPYSTPSLIDRHTKQYVFLIADPVDGVSWNSNCSKLLIAIITSNFFFFVLCKSEGTGYGSETNTIIIVPPYGQSTCRKSSVVVVIRFCLYYQASPFKEYSTLCRHLCDGLNTT